MATTRKGGGGSAAAFLDDFPPEVARTARTLRALVWETLPDVEERVYPRWRGLGYRHPDAGYFCGIFPHLDHVRLLFEHGVRVPDPDGLLEGEGRQTRYVVVRDPGLVAPDALRRLLMTALHQRVLERAVAQGRARPHRPHS